MSGTLYNFVDARNIIISYQYLLERPVIYDANGGTGTMETYNAYRGEKIEVKENAFDREGYDFQGWNTSADGSGTAYTAGDILTMGAVESVTLYAQWKPAPVSPPVVTTRNLTVNKVWVGDEGTDARPDSIQVQLYQSGAAYGSPVTLNAGNGWSHTWIGLSTVGTLTVEELNIPDGYTATQVNSGSTVTITNTYDEEIPDDPVPEGTPKPTPTPTPAPSEKPTPGPSATPDPGDEPIEDPDVPMGTPKPTPKPTPTPTPAPSEKPTPGPSATPDPGDEPIEDPDVPKGTPDPGDEPIEDPDVPMGTPKPVKPSTPDNGEEIPDEKVPLAKTPKTGDDSGIWMTLALVSAAGLVFLGISRKRKGENVR